MRVVFVWSVADLFDMLVDGRAGEYDLPRADFAQALRRRRIPIDATVLVAEEDGGMRPYSGRR